MYQGRIEMFNKEYGLAYGNDHIVGLFVQVWSINPKFGARHFENMPDDANIKVDLDQMNTPGLDVKRIVAVGEEYGFVIEPPEETINYD